MHFSDFNNLFEPDEAFLECQKALDIGGQKVKSIEIDFNDIIKECASWNEELLNKCKCTDNNLTNDQIQWLFSPTNDVIVIEDESNSQPDIIRNSEEQTPKSSTSKTLEKSVAKPKTNQHRSEFKTCYELQYGRKAQEDRDKRKEQEKKESAMKFNEESSPEADERFKNIEPKLIEIIKGEMMEQCDSYNWDDISGLDYPKRIIQETVVLPILRPQLFTGLRRPPRAILLFGPPGTGKTLIGKCIASQSKAKFFSISASSLTSKWIGEGEKLVRTLFTLAAAYQPSVVFIDEIDSLLGARSESEHEASRRMKTEFLVRLDGATTSDTDQILIVGATNRPQELDEAVRRRLVKRLYIPLPDLQARISMLKKLVEKDSHILSENEFEEIAKSSDGYSGADIKSLCQEAFMGPIREIPTAVLINMDVKDVRKVNYSDFEAALKRVKASVDNNSLAAYAEWDKLFGCGTN